MNPLHIILIIFILVSVIEGIIIYFMVQAEAPGVHELEKENQKLKEQDNKLKRMIEKHNHNLVVIDQAMERIKNEWDTQFVLLLAETLDENFLLSLIPPGLNGLKILGEDHYEAIASSELALSACGTANLEAALLETPLVAFYRLSPLTYFFGHRLATVKNFSIVNILAGERIIPELIQRDFTAQNIFEEVKKIFDSEEKKSEMKAQFRKIKKLLGDKIAPQNAARELEKLIKQ